MTYPAQDRGGSFPLLRTDRTLKTDRLETRRPPRADLYATSQVSALELTDVPAAHHDLVPWAGRSPDHLASPCRFHGAVKVPAVAWENNLSINSF